MTTRTDQPPLDVEEAPVKASVPATVTRTQVVEQSIARIQPRIQAIYPAGLDVDRFRNLVLSAIKSTPQLMECFATPDGEVSLLLAAMNAAAVGLEPNTPLGHAWLLPRRNKKTNSMEAQLSIGYRGYQKLARRAGNVKVIFADVVKEGDVFEWHRGLESDHLLHTPGDAADRASREVTHAYAVARYTDGGYSFVVLPWADIEKRRAMSDSWSSATGRPYSPWTKWPDEMARKTALRVLCTTQLDLSTQAELTMASEERTVTLGDDDMIVDVDTGEVLELESSEP